MTIFPKLVVPHLLFNEKVDVDVLLSAVDDDEGYNGVELFAKGFVV